MKLLGLLLLLSAPALAQDRVISAISGVGSSFNETLILEISASDPYQLDIVVVRRNGFTWDTETEMIRFEGALFLPPNNIPALVLRDNGTILIDELGCFACGRYHSGKSMILQSVDDVWRVIGYTESIVDRHEPWRFGVCDVNLLSGQADITLADEPVKRVKASGGPVMLVDLDDNYRPEICEMIHLDEEEWEPMKPADWDE